MHCLVTALLRTNPTPLVKHLYVTVLLIDTVILYSILLIRSLLLDSCVLSMNREERNQEPLQR